MEWTFEEDYIICRFCEDHQDLIITGEILGELMEKLVCEGFATRSKTAVQRRAKDCQNLFYGWEVPRASALQKERCKCFVRRKLEQEKYSDLELFLENRYGFSEETDLGTFTTAAPSVAALLPIDSPSPTFVELLRTYINRRNMTEPEVYRRAQIGRDTFSKIYSGKKGASKDTVMQLCFGLKLTYEESVLFMSTANHGFNSSEIRDLVVVYCLKNQMYDTYKVNVELCERKEKILFDGRYPYYQ